MSERPAIRVLIAFPLGDGEICRVTHIVDLFEARIRLEEGWQIVGPDPDDWDAFQYFLGQNEWPKSWTRWSRK